MSDTTAPAAANRLLTRISKEFPELTWVNYSYIDEGWDHEVIILDDNIVFRFPTDAEYTAKLGHEIEVLNYLSKKFEASTPEYLFIPKGIKFAGYKLIQGEQLNESYFKKLKAHDNATLTRQLAEFLTIIHTQNTKEMPLAATSPSFLPADQALVKAMAEKHLKQVLTNQEYAIVQNILSDIDDLLTQVLPVIFIHNDIYSRHLLWDTDSQKLGIIDFSDMCLGDPAVDFAELHEYGVNFVKNVYEQYYGPKDDTFLERAWKYQRWAAVYMMTDHFENYKTSFEVAKQTFNNVEGGMLLQK